MSAHFDEELELYALGALDAGERRAVDVHVAECETCLAALAVAEHSASALAELYPHYRAPHRKSPKAALPARRMSQWGALAATLLVGLGIGSGIGIEVFRQHAVPDDGALVAIAQSHFAHVSVPMRGTAATKILYSRSGDWLYVVTGSPHSLHISIAHAAGGASQEALTRVEGDAAAWYGARPGIAAPGTTVILSQPPRGEELGRVTLR